jgi:hypothetical protein
MMFRPQRVLISRNGNDHEPWQQVPGVMTAVPNVGESFQMFLETGKVMRTSPVTRVAQNGNEIVVDTRNSRYRLQLAS